MVSTGLVAEAARGPSIRPLGVALAVLALAGLYLPFIGVRANRIVPGIGQGVWAGLPPTWAALVVLAAGLAAAACLFRILGPRWQAAIAAGAFIVIVLALGVAAEHNTPAGDTLTRVAPKAGFWLLLAATGAALADAAVRLELHPWARLAALAGTLAAIAALLGSGALAEVSVMREYAARAESFWQQALVHVELSFGALAAAALIGIPLGIGVQRLKRFRAGVLGTLNAVQTIPSIALFGLLIAPLAFLAASLPTLKSLGISGVGAAPAFVALLLYGLMPIVSTVVAAIEGVPRAIVDAARGMGMTRRQRLFATDLPLGLPVILTGVRIVLVQNIGMTTIAALIGGGGFGTFVFQGAGESAMDLVLLGVVPTVLLAGASGIALDALIDLAGARR